MPLGTRLVIIALSLASAITTWLGFRNSLSSEDLDWVREGLPVILAACSFAAILEMYFGLFSWSPTPKKEKVKFYVASAITAVAILGISTIFSVIGLGGKSAMLYHMNSEIKKAEEIFSKLSGKVESEGKIGASADLLSRQGFSLSRDEDIRGTMTTFKGGGAVTDKLASIGGTLGNIKDAVERSIASRRRTLEDAENEIFKMRELIVSDQLIPKKIRAFGRSVSRLNQYAQKIQAGEVSQLVKNFSENLKGLTVTVSQIKSGTDLGVAQDKALKEISGFLDNATEVLSKASRDEIEKPVEISPLSSIDMGRAIFIYSYAIAPQWVAAIVFDFAALLFRFIRLGVARQREEEDARELEDQLAELRKID